VILEEIPNYEETKKMWDTNNDSRFIA
jgi:hypothetical protein